MRLGATKSSATSSYNGLGNQLWDLGGARPSLDLNFAGNKNLSDSISTKNLITFTRASSGTYVGSDGLIKTATTNLLLQSEDFSTTWSADGATSVTTNTIISPASTLTADTLTVSGGGANRVSQSYSVPSAGTYTFSVYAKAGTGNLLQLRQFLSGNDAYVIFNFSTGVMGSVSGGTSASASATTLPNGWYRLVLTNTYSGAASINIRIGGAVGSTETNTTFYLWGAQLEQSSTVGEYIPTTSTINSAPRFDHNPTTGESLGLLVEESRTNLLTNSAGDTGWTTTNITKNLRASVVAPDGTLGVYEIAASSVTPALTRFNAPSISTTSGATYCQSAFFKAAGVSTVALFTNTTQSNPDFANSGLYVNLTTGSVSGSPAAGTQFYTIPYPNGWWRVVNIFPADVTGLGALFSCTPGSTGNVNAVAGNGTDGVYVWGAQLEAGSFPTSYIPTTTATVTRSADVASITGSNFSSWYNQTEGTVFADCLGVNIISGATRRYLEIRDGAIAERFLVGYSSSANGRFLVIDNNSSVADISIASSLSPRVAATYALNDFQASANGTLGTPDGAGTLPTVDRLILGSQDSATANTFLNGTIRRLTYWPQRLPNATLQQITQ